MVYLSDIIIIITTELFIIFWHYYDDDNDSIMAHTAALYVAGSIYIYSLLHTRLQCDLIYYIIAHFAAFYVARSIVVLDSTLLVPVQSVWKENFFSVVTINVVIVIVIAIVTIIREANT